MKEPKETEDGRRLLGQMSEMAGMPKDVVLGVPILTMIGRTELMVENYRGILEYTDLLIRIQTKCGQLRITGKRLTIEYYTNDEMKITGKLSEIQYLS